jgi:hypothetical protein
LNVREHHPVQPDRNAAGTLAWCPPRSAVCRLKLPVRDWLDQFTKTAGLPEAVVSVSGPRTAENDIAGVVDFAAGHRLFDPACRVFTGWLLKAIVDPVFDALPLICVVE